MTSTAPALRSEWTHAMRAALWTCALGCAGSEEAASTDDTAFVLDPQLFRFCHEPGRDAGEALPFCAALDAADRPPPCPGLRATCDGAEPVRDAAGCMGPMTGIRSNRLANAPESGWGDWNDWDFEGCSSEAETPEGLDQLVRWITAGAVGILVLIAARLILSTIGRPTPAPAAPRAPTAAPAELAADAPPSGLPDPLGEAESHLRAGRFDAAILSAREAALVALTERRAIRRDASRTDRERVAELRDRPERAAWRDLVRVAEALEWQGAPPAIPQARRAIDAARLILAAGLALLAVTAPATGWAFDRWAPDGDAALVDLLGRDGHTVRWHAGALSDLDGVDVLVLDTSGVAPTREDWDALRTFVSDGGTVIVAGEADGLRPLIGARRLVDDEVTLAWAEVSFPHPERPPSWDGPVTVFDLEPGAFPVVFALDPATGAPIGVDRVSEIEADPTDTDAPNAIIVEAEPFEIADEAQDERDDERATDEATPAPEAPPEPLGGDPAPPEGEPQEDEPRMFVPVAGVYVGQGLILAISDADLLWNGALVLRRNGAFLRSLVNARGPCDGPCVVSLATLSGGGADTPLDTMLNARMMPFVLHLLAWWALLGVARGVRFRHAPEPAVDDRADFREHARALGRHYERLDATAHAAARLAAFHLGQHGGGRQGLELALGRAGWSTTDAAALAREADERARGERHDHHRPDPWFLEEMCRIR